MDISVRQVRSFLTVASTGNFTQAAAALNMAQPTLTVQIRRLEEALGVKLFDRNTRSVSLTRVGRELLPQLSRTVQDLDTVLLNLRGVAAATHGIVRVAALPSFAAGFLPDAIRTFRETRPSVTFHVRDVVAGPMLELLRSEAVDLAVTGGEIAQGDLEVLATGQDDMQVVFPEGHPIARRRRITAAVLAQYPLILMAPDTSVRAVTDAAFAREGLAPVAASEATYMMTAVGMVRAGLGLAILPASAREVRAEPTLKTQVISDDNFRRSISLVKRRERSLSPVTRMFADSLLSLSCFRDRVV